MEAWITIDEDEGTGDIFFLADGIIPDAEDGTEATMCPEFDKYADLGYVPPDILVKEHGWWYGCQGCGVRVHEDNEDVDQCFSVGNQLFCSQQCKDDLDIRIENRNKEYADFQTAILSLFPTYTITGFTGGWPSHSPTAYFTFPGQKYQDGELRCVAGALRHHVCTGDIDAFNAWRDINKKPQILNKTGA